MIVRRIGRRGRSIVTKVNTNAVAEGLALRFDGGKGKARASGEVRPSEARDREFIVAWRTRNSPKTQSETFS